MFNDIAAAERSPLLDSPFGLSFADLYSIEGLARVDARFIDELKAADRTLAERLLDARMQPDALDPRREAALLIDIAPHVEDFLARLFGIAADVQALEAQHHALAPLFSVKRQFVQRKAMNAWKADVAATFDGDALRAELDRLLACKATVAANDTQAIQDFERAFAEGVTRWQQDESANAVALDLAARYAAWASHTAAGKAMHRRGVLFRAPRKLDQYRLVPVETIALGEVEALQIASAHAVRRRDGFALTDAGTDLVGALDQAHYCIWCHEQGKDSCARGLPAKQVPATPAPISQQVSSVETPPPASQQAPPTETNPFKKSAFGVTLAGCPLEERISEFHKLRAEGWPLGALAMICIDNPMAAATGHRICNDCMKSCIYQKQDPVDIPQSETRLLKDVLALPWGFEIYALLTRWNPLDLRRPWPLPPSGRRVLVVGQGPAGFTLAHHLLNDGHAVVAIDGLKIEPLEPTLSGVTAAGERVPFVPIRDFDSLLEPL